MNIEKHLNKDRQDIMTELEKLKAGLEYDYESNIYHMTVHRNRIKK